MIIENGRSCFYQWDLGQRLLMDDCPPGIEVHLAVISLNSLDTVGFDSALVVKSYAENETTYADVPNRLLQVAGELKVYIFDRAGNQGCTVFIKTFTIIPRPRPADYIFTESEIKRWEALDQRITEIELHAPESGLIPVTSADNGKVMGVVNGKWATMNIPNAVGIVNVRIEEV